MIAGAAGGGEDVSLSDSSANDSTDLYSAAAVCLQFHALCCFDSRGLRVPS